MRLHRIQLFQVKTETGKQNLSDTHLLHEHTSDLPQLKLSTRLSDGQVPGRNEFPRKIKKNLILVPAAGNTHTPNVSRESKVGNPKNPSAVGWPLDRL